MAAPGWCSSAAKGILFAAFASAANAEDARPAVVTIPAVTAAEAPEVYTDPRRRFTIRHDADWKLMTNFTGGVEAFCRWEECRKTVMTGCSLSLQASDGLTEDDLGLFASMLAAGTPAEGFDLGLLGTGMAAPGGAIKEIAGRRWFVSAITIKLFDAVPLENRDWWGLADQQLLHVSCMAHEAIMPRLSEEVDQLLAGFTLTQP